MDIEVYMSYLFVIYVTTFDSITLLGQKKCRCLPRYVIILTPIMIIGGMMGRKPMLRQLYIPSFLTYLLLVILYRNFFVPSNFMMVGLRYLYLFFDGSA